MWRRISKEATMRNCPLGIRAVVRSGPVDHSKRLTCRRSGFRDTPCAGTRCIDALKSLLRRYVAEASICLSRIDAFAGISSQGPGQEALKLLSVAVFEKKYQKIKRPRKCRALKTSNPLRDRAL